MTSDFRVNTRMYLLDGPYRQHPRRRMMTFPVTTTKTDPVARAKAQELAALRPGSVLRAVSPTVILVLNHKDVKPRVWKPSQKEANR